MSIKNEFENHLKINHDIPDEIRESITFVHDSMRVSKLISVSIFGEKPPENSVIQIYDRIVERLDYVVSCNDNTDE